MGLFDLGNKTKAYKRATTNTAEVDKEKIDELTQALKTTEDNLVGGLGLLQDDVSDVSDILASDAKEKLLGLVQKLSFKENLDDTSKAFMVATLVTLGHEIGDTSDLQKHYLRAISRYLEVSPTDGADIYGIENITDAETSQLIFRAVNEYLFLYNGTRNLVRSNQKITDYFDCFNINNRTKEKVIADIQDRISVMGNEGLIIPFEVTDEKINAQTAENIATAEAKSEGEDSRTNGKDDVEDDIYAKQKMVGNILEPIKYFQGYYISIFPKVDIVKAREICGYDYLNVEKDNIIGVLCGSGDDGIFGSLSHRIGVVFLKDRVISNRQTYGHVTKKHVKFNVTLYQDLKIEEKPDKSYVAYNGINWNVGSPKQADKMVAVLNELKEKASQIMAGTLVESRQVNDENSQGTLEGLAKIISPIQGFKEEITSVYPQADLSKAKQITGFQYMDVNENNLLAVMVPESKDVVFGELKDTVGVVFLKDRVISNRMPFGALKKSKMNFDVTLYKDFQAEALMGKNTFINYSGINWELKLPEDAVQMVDILNKLKKAILEENSKYKPV